MKQKRNNKQKTNCKQSFNKIDAIYKIYNKDLHEKTQIINYNKIHMNEIEDYCTIYVNYQCIGFLYDFIFRNQGNYVFTFFLLII